MLSPIFDVKAAVYDASRDLTRAPGRARGWLAAACNDVPGDERGTGHRDIDAGWSRQLRRGLLGGLFVAVGGTGTAVLPPSAWLVSFPPVDLLRSGPLTRWACLVLLLGGMALLAHAWIELGREVLRRPGTAPSAVVRIAALWSLPFLLAPPLFSRDAWSYAAQGAISGAGLNPYEIGPRVLDGPIVEAVDPLWLATPAPYGPITLSLGGLVSHLTLDPYLLALFHRLLALLGVVLLAYAIPRIARRTGTSPALASWLVVANPAVLAHFIGGAHNDALMIGLAALAVAQTLDRGWQRGALIAGLAASVKVPGGLAVIAVVALVSLSGTAQRVRRLILAGGLASGVVVLAGLVTHLGMGWVHALDVPGTLRTWLSLPTAAGAAAQWALGSSGYDDLAAAAPQTLRVIGMLAALAVLAVLALRAPRRHAVSAAGLALLAVVLLGPVVHPWYLLWALPFLAAGRPSRRTVMVLVVGSTLLTTMAPLDSSLRGTGPTTVAAVVFALAAATALLSGLRGLVPPAADAVAAPSDFSTAGPDEALTPLPR